MGNQRETTLILGEGQTEFYYFNSLKDVFKGITIKPDYPKHTSINELEKKIEEGITMGYDRIFCVIDMDTKDQEPERSQYKNLKDRFKKPIGNDNNDIHCIVEFFETHRCTELFFLYYFRYTSCEYGNQNLLLDDLNKKCKYCKKIKFFRTCKGLHSYFEKNGGSLKNAIINSELSIKEKSKTGRDYTYSELGRMMNKLNERYKC